MQEQGKIDLAKSVEIGDVKQWTTWDIINWKVIKRDDKVLFDFKKKWVKGYAEVIKAAAKKYDLPEYLVAGVAYVEVGGDPFWIDDVTYFVRDKTGIGKEVDLTSYGNVSIQVEVAARTLGYDPDNLTDTQKKSIIDSIKDPKQNILISAMHISDLRDIDFKGTRANGLTENNVKIIDTRYNRGPNLSINDIKKNMSYGEFIVSRKSILEDLIK